MTSLKALHAAAEIIETRGAAGFEDAVKVAGLEPSMALLVAYLRRALGPPAFCPPDSSIDAQVNTFIRKEMPGVSHAL